MKITARIQRLFLLLLLSVVGCKNYLDIVPDNIATIENAFTNRAEAEKFLFTCYSYMPREDHPEANPAFQSGDEFWIYWPITPGDYNTLEPYNIARGLQNKVNVNMNFWDGSYVESLWKGIRNCNILIENVDKVPDLEPFLKSRWKAEAKFLKAYFHWYLFRMYGPIPIVDKNLSISATTEEVRIKRQPVDSVVNYIVGQIDEALNDDPQNGLPSVISNQASELGRVTRVAALSIKAKVLATAASPLFNGNPDFTNFENSDGAKLFPAEFRPEKWQQALEATEEAIAACRQAGVELFEFEPGVLDLDRATQIEMSIRNSVCQPWNEELIWGYTASGLDDPSSKQLQLFVTPQFDPNNISINLRGQMAPTLKMAELFYTANGVPIQEDTSWPYGGRYQLKETTERDSLLIQDYKTVALHFDREPRFYASVAFDGSLLFMKNGRWDIRNKSGQTSGIRQSRLFSVTGYYAKKLINWNTVPYTGGFVAMENYPWPIIRYADLLLLHAECLNEVNRPAEALMPINQIRARAGLKSVEEAWTNFSSNPAKYQSQAGLREIIRQERLIELAFEGQRFWDLRRWKLAASVLNAPVFGWDITGEDYETYNRRKLLFDQKFVAPRDYFWPISDNTITINPNLVQNPGW